jgi:hypothetical protein
MDLKDKKVRVVPYEFDEEICNVVNYHGCIYVQEGSLDKKIIYRTEMGKWRVLLENIKAYCFDGEDIYYVRTDTERACEVFYRMNLSSKSKQEISTAKYSLHRVVKIWIENGELLYQQAKSFLGIGTTEGKIKL